MQAPIGISNFRTIVTKTDSLGNHCLFVDKTLFIKDIIDNLAEVILITRPRRFGKTLNMSMLHHFFAYQVDDQPTKGLFDNLKIAAKPECMQYQSQFPVIYLTLKDIKAGNFNDAYEGLQYQVSKLYMQYKALLFASPKISEDERIFYQKIIDGEATRAAMRQALKNLTEQLYKVFAKKIIVLIDEYDTPIQAAYLENYYKEMVDFMREFLGAALKDNSYLQKSVLTGILRVAKESLFSGLNNIKTYSLLDSSYGEYFGFTESEVDELLTATNFSHNIKAVKAWYNGYKFGQAVVYNPWSIINYLAEKGNLSPYWVNTSDNALIKQLLINSTLAFKQQFEVLLQDQQIEMRIHDYVVFSDLSLNGSTTSNEAVVWTLFLMSGYLKATVLEKPNQVALYKLEIPNKEVKDLYQTLIAEWLSGVNNSTVFNTFLNNLLQGQMEYFVAGLRTIMLQTFSVHDVKGTAPEKFYHGFMLGLIASIDRDQYQIASNKESGLGRYDIALIPNDVVKLGVVLELKSLGKNLRLQEAADLALKQIDNKQYVTTMAQHNIKQCLKVGIAFGGKELAVAYQIATTQVT